MWFKSWLQRSRLQIDIPLGRAVVFAALCLPALGSCASPPQSFDISRFTGLGIQQEQTPLQYFDWVSSIPPREQLVEKIRVRTRFEESGDMTEGVQLALLTGLIEPVAREELLRAVDILNEILLRYRDGPVQEDDSPSSTKLSVALTGSITPEYAQFAELWRTALLQRVTVMTISDEHSRQRVELEQLNRQLLENNLRLQEENEVLRTENPLLREENESLLLQIEALKAIEQQMNRREQQQEFP